MVAQPGRNSVGPLNSQRQRHRRTRLPALGLLDKSVEDSHSTGRLRIYLGYAAGVGKTYQMLEEAREMKQQGRDLVIGYFEPHGRKDTIAKTEGLEIIPRRRIEYRGSIFE